MRSVSDTPESAGSGVFLFSAAALRRLSRAAGDRTGRPHTCLNPAGTPEADVRPPFFCRTRRRPQKTFKITSQDGRAANGGARSKNRDLTKPRFRSKITVYIAATRRWGRKPPPQRQRERRVWCERRAPRQERHHPGAPLNRASRLLKECRFALR